ncbi:hypothetical protein JCGZ_13701 [Jatropha curcas]|uniref:CI111 double-psi beta barrel domain-containing protein n=1 Tax=Jatropha curcas TaxID=180498 RepID=A0A067KKW7_JATCU|nr:hypothetical protein JCGZ_13701 [Jatropha curcas]
MEKGKWKRKVEEEDEDKDEERKMKWNSRVSPAASKRILSNSFPLCSTSDECTRQFEAESMEDEKSNELRNYFAFAMVFPS